MKKLIIFYLIASIIGLDITYRESDYFGIVLCSVGIIYGLVAFVREIIFPYEE